ncbi:hypothetical protein C9374_000640 [Naegleria lovaniensis]|uniref:Uncharacterized protein n=1 Tax=Naegleria lovaniensis TaxID=51637 RepID=A0AA88GYS1_NAELO|nr:uncharacterized protein C9374_000640 [Naegleria lovaniensis]KAG2388476.1 hypothetical protein C9374_000640 [Naegleria lovaniensis]
MTSTQLRTTHSEQQRKDLAPITSPSMATITSVSPSYGILSMDLLISHIFPNFSWNWLFAVARLVSREWNKIITSPDIDICIESILTINSFTMSDKNRIIFIRQCMNNKFGSVTGIVLKGLEISFFEETAMKVHSQFKNQPFNLFSYFPKLQRVLVESIYSFEKVLPYMAKGNLQYLKKFEIYSNTMHDTDMQEFKSINLQSFQSLTMVRCHINDGVCDQLLKNNFSSLTELNLYGNAVKHDACHKISELSNLTMLNLCHNDIGPPGCLHLSKMTNLRKLFLKGCSISNQGCEYLSQMTEPTSLTELDVSSNNIDKNGCKHLKCFKNLLILDISNNTIGGEGLALLFEHESLPRLTDLDISRCEISNDLESFVTHAPRHIVRLNLASNTLREIAPLCDEKFSHLSHLNLCVNQLSGSACRDIAECKYFSKLTFLDLTFNQIQASGCGVLSNKNLSNLKTLTLAHNTITGEGLKNLSNGTLSSLETLILSSNSIGDEGCQFLANGVFPSLTDLSLSHNAITENGCLCFQRGTNNFPRLKCITLSGNEINDNGCKYLAETNQWKRTEIDVIISGNQISGKGHEYLCKANYAKVYTGISTVKDVYSRKSGCLQM